MQAQLRAVRAAVHSVGGKPHLIRFRNLAALTTVTLMLAACMPATVPLADRDPADPAARVAGASYRSTVAPYSSLRPSAPSSWREQNDRAAPVPKSGRSE